MKTLGVIANTRKEQAAAVLQRLLVKAVELGVKIVPDQATAGLLGLRGETLSRDALRTVEAVMVLGGDGTMLRAVRELDGLDIPVIGVNLGSLGFMTSVAEKDLERGLECLVRRDYTLSLREMMDCSTRRGNARSVRYRALNDMVMTALSTRVVTLRMRVDGEDVGDFVCDGLIVSTPTGSTGHSLSAGGPVLLPAARAFVVSLICPHTLSTRPLVLPDDARIEVQVVRSVGDVALAADGQVSESLKEGDIVEVSRSAQGVRFIHLPGYSYFAVLRQKLHWRGTNV